MKTRAVCLGFVVVVCVLSMGFTAGSALAAGKGADWERVIQGGFGDSRNYQIQAMEAFDGYLYAGTFGWAAFPTTMSQIWRTADGTQWELVRDTNDAGLRDFIVFNDYLFASTWNGKILRSADGLEWETMVSDVFTPGFLYGVMRFEVFEGMLYGSVTGGSGGVEIWRSADGLVWEPFGDPGFGNPTNSNAEASAVFKGHLYWGTSNYATLIGELWRNDGNTVEQLPNFGFGNAQIISLISYNNFLYARTLGFNPIEGLPIFKIWRSLDGVTWEDVSGIVASFDFGASSMIIHQGQLYLFAMNLPLGLDGWRTGGKTGWEQIASGGFGHLYNESVMPNAAASFKGNLYIGVSTAFGGPGVEVWRLCTGVCK